MKKRNPFLTFNIFLIISVFSVVSVAAYNIIIKNTGILPLLCENILNIIFIVIMLFVLYFDAVKCRKKLNDITIDLSRLESNIENKISIDSGCKTDFINKYLNEFDRDKKDSKILPDIADYINEHTIAAYTHKGIADQVSNVMTALGILGTFIGLSVGLQNFDPSNLEVSTQQLMEGIKTAFATSVFGIIASILHTHFYHRDLEKNDSALESFYGVFYSKQANYPEISFYNKVINQNNDEPELIAKAIAPYFGELLTKTLTPLSEHLNKSLDEYIEKTIEKQSGVLQSMVNRFMDNLNNSLDNQFLRLSRSIEDMCNWQGDFIKTSSGLLESIQITTESLSDVNIKTTESERLRIEAAEKTSALIDNVKCYSDGLKAYIDELISWGTELKEESAKHLSCVEKLEKFSSNIETASQGASTQFENAINKFAEYRNETETRLNAQRKINDDLMASIKMVIKQLDSYTKENNEHLQQNSSSFNNAVNKLVTLNNSLKENVDLISSQFEVMEQNVNDLINQLKRG